MMNQRTWLVFMEVPEEARKACESLFLFNLLIQYGHGHQAPLSTKRPKGLGEGDPFGFNTIINNGKEAALKIAGLWQDKVKEAGIPYTIYLWQPRCTMQLPLAGEHHASFRILAQKLITKSGEGHWKMQGDMAYFSWPDSEATVKHLQDFHDKLAGARQKDTRECSDVTYGPEDPWKTTPEIVASSSMDIAKQLTDTINGEAGDAKRRRL